MPEGQPLPGLDIEIATAGHRAVTPNKYHQPAGRSLFRRAPTAMDRLAEPEPPAQVWKIAL
jgi:hypothetical protein